MRRNIEIMYIKDRTIIMDLDHMNYVSVNTDGYCPEMLDNDESKIIKALEYKSARMAPRSENYINSLYLMVTEKCNLSCKFCCMRSDVHTDEKEARMLKFDDMEGMLPKLEHFKPRKIFITGGEPLLNNEVYKIAKYLKQHTKAFITIQSNGVFIDENTVKHLRDCVDAIDMSSGHYENIGSISKKIELCKENQIDLTITYTYDSSLHNLLNIIELAVQQNVAFVLNFISMTGSALDHDIKPATSREILQVHTEVVRFILEHNYENSRVARMYFRNLMLRQSCSALGNMLAVYPDGKTYICHSLNCDEFYLGNFLVDDYKMIANNLEETCNRTISKKLFDVTQKAVCKDCKFKYFCTGFCGATIYYESNSFDECIMNQFLISFLLVDYDRKRSNKDNLINFLEQCNDLLDVKKSS